MSDTFWWKTYKGAEQEMFDGLVGLTQELGRLPTEEEAHSRVTIQYCSSYGSFQELLRVVAGRTGRYGEWQKRQQEIWEAEKTRRKERAVVYQRVATERQIQQRVQITKQCERNSRDLSGVKEVRRRFSDEQLYSFIWGILKQYGVYVTES